jgi:hypothetical protein
MKGVKKNDDNSYRSFFCVKCEERSFSALKTYNKDYWKIEGVELI